MIVKQNLNPIKIWTYTKVPMLISIAWSFSVWLCFYITGWEYLAINFTPIGVLGSALAIFVAFRNNAAYGRWWEARTLWGGIVNSSRVLSRLIITFTDSHGIRANRSGDKVRIAQYISMMPAEEDNEELKNWRVNSWKDRVAPSGYAFPGDPRKFEQTRYETANLSDLGKKLLGVDKW